MNAQSQRALAALLAALIVAVPACGSDSPFDPAGGAPELRVPAVLVAVTGEHQAGFPHEVMRTLIVEVLDEHNRAVLGAEVRFEVETGDGRVSPEKVVTGPAGRAGATWTLGPNPGENSLVASVVGLPGVKFTARAFGPGVRFHLEELNGIPSDRLGVSGLVVLEEGYYLARFDDWWFERCEGYGSYEISDAGVVFTPVVAACHAFTRSTTASLDGGTLIVEEESSVGTLSRWVFRTREAAESDTGPQMECGR